MDDLHNELFAAICREDVILVKILINNPSIDINTRDDDGFTPLHIASSQSNLGLFETLLDRGGDIQNRSDAGATLLHATAFSGNIPITKKLLIQGVDVNAQDNYGETPLHDAASMGHKQMEKLLILWGARVDIQNKLGQTAVDVSMECRAIAPKLRLVQRGEAA